MLELVFPGGLVEDGLLPPCSVATESTGRAAPAHPCPAPAAPGPSSALPRKENEHHVALLTPFPLAHLLPISPSSLSRALWTPIFASTSPASEGVPS